MQSHIDELIALGVDEDIIDEIKSDHPDYPYALLTMSRFITGMWEGVEEPAMPFGWLNNTLTNLHDQRNSAKPALQLIDQRPQQLNDLKAAIETLLADNVDQDALLSAIRLSQRGVLGVMVDDFDQGRHGSLFETKIDNGERIPTRGFFDFLHYVFEYDPAKKLQQ